MAELPPAIARAQLPDRAKLVAGELWRGQKPGTPPWSPLTRRVLGERLGVGENTIKRAIRDLRAAQLIERAVRDDGVAGWLLRLPGERRPAPRTLVIVIGGEE